MNGQLIFKMELFKYLRDKAYLIVALVLLVLNALSVGIISFMNPLDSRILYGVSIFMLFLLIVISIVFLGIVYPFHLVSIDYKNRVIALMIASGVNRTKLFFSKVGATFLATIAMFFALWLLPILMLIIKVIQAGGWEAFTSGLGEAFSSITPDVFPLFLSLFLQFTAAIVTIMAATIILQGKTISILLYFGFNLIISFVTSILGFSNLLSAFQITGQTLTTNLWLSCLEQLVVIIVFSLISLQTLKHQNL